MINAEKLKAYCSEDISHIENYDQAVADKVQTWQCHHKAEVLPCGRYSVDDLKKFNLYYSRPACELVLLTEFEHKSLHKNHTGKKQTTETKLKISLSQHGKPGNRKGMHHTEEAREKIRKALTGRHLPDEVKNKLKNKVWANNGTVSKMFDRDFVPPNWTLGRIRN